MSKEILKEIYGSSSPYMKILIPEQLAEINLAIFHWYIQKVTIGLEKIVIISRENVDKINTMSLETDTQNPF